MSDFYNSQFNNPTFNSGLSFNENNMKMLQHRSNNLNTDRFIIDNRRLDTRDVEITKYTSDVINPIRRKELKQIVSIDALFRDSRENSLTSDFVFTLQETMKNVVSMKLCSVELPNIWYSFSSQKRNNEFKVIMKNLNNGSGMYYNKTYTVVIPDGNYTVDEFTKMINNLFHNIEPNGGLDFLKVMVDNITGRVIIRANDAGDSDLGTSPAPYDTTSPYYSPNLYYELDFVIDDMPERPIYKNCGWMIGFKKEKYIARNTTTFTDYISFSDTSVLYRNYLISESIYGSGINTYVFLVIDDFNNNFKDTIYSGKDVNYIHDNIIARLPVTSGSNTLILSSPADLVFKQRDYFGPVTIDKLKIKLVDKYGDVIDLNNNNFSFCLEFTQLYS